MTFMEKILQFNEQQVNWKKAIRKLLQQCVCVWSLVPFTYFVTISHQFYLCRKIKRTLMASRYL